MTRPYHVVRSVSMRPSEWDAIKQAAAKAGVSVNAFVRSAALDRALRVETEVLIKPS